MPVQTSDVCKKKTWAALIAFSEVLADAVAAVAAIAYDIALSALRRHCLSAMSPTRSLPEHVADATGDIA